MTSAGLRTAEHMARRMLAARRLFEGGDRR